LGTLLHAIEDLMIDDMIFHQEDITLFQQELYYIFSIGKTSQQEEKPLDLIIARVYYFLLSKTLKLN
jgi:hypothetical protein